MIISSTLRALMQARGFNQSDLARMANVSRQAVSLWLGKGDGAVDIHGRNLLALTRALNASLEDLAAPLPKLAPEVRTELLWDGLYPDLPALAAAAVAGEARALARVVEVYGLYRSAQMLGEDVWARFPEYARFLPPARRAGLKRVWALHSNPA